MPKPGKIAKKKKAAESDASSSSASSSSAAKPRTKQPSKKRAAASASSSSSSSSSESSGSESGSESDHDSDSESVELNLDIDRMTLESSCQEYWIQFCKHSFHTYEDVSVMYHHTWPDRKAVIVALNRLVESKANDDFYDRWLQSRADAPRVTFAMINVWRGEVPEVTQYPLHYTGKDRIPRVDIRLDSFADDNRFSWFFLGSHYPYLRPNAKSQSATIQVHVVLLEKGVVPAHDEWCNEHLVPLDLNKSANNPNKLLWKDEDGVFSCAHQILVRNAFHHRDVQVGRFHSVRFNIAFVGDIDFGRFPIDGWGDSTHAINFDWKNRRSR